MRRSPSLSHAPSMPKPLRWRGGVRNEGGEVQRGAAGGEHMAGWQSRPLRVEQLSRHLKPGTCHNERSTATAQRSAAQRTGVTSVTTWQS